LIETQDNSSEYVLIDEEKTKCFKVNKIEVTGSYVKKASSFYVGIVTKGTGSIITNNESYLISEGHKFFVPYKTETVKFESVLGMDILITHPPS
jgi:mannose-6-phosphate isomerase class I